MPRTTTDKHSNVKPTRLCTTKHTANKAHRDTARTHRKTHNTHTIRETHNTHKEVHNKGLTRHTQCVILYTVTERRQRQ